MDFRQLETLIAIAKFKSFSKAAEYLYLTQPTISSHISNLETELDTVLINRFNKNISLTKAGDVLYDYAINIINLRENAKFKLGEFKGKIVGNLEISSSTVPGQYILPDILYDFSKIYPDVTFNMTHYDSAKVVDGIISGDIDFGIVGDLIPNNHLKYVKLTDDELVVIMPYSENYGENGQSINLKDILKEKFVFRERGSGTRNIFENALKDQGLNSENLNIIAYIENTEAIKQCVIKGLGISILSFRAIETEIKYKMLNYAKIKDLKLKRNFYFVYHSQRSPSPLEIEFQSFVLNYLCEKQ